MKQNLEFKIRNYKDSDYKDVKFNLQESDMFHPDWDSRKILSKKIMIYPWSIIVAEYNEQVVGNLYIIHDPWQSMIFRLAVRKKYRNNGVGTSLMHVAHERLKQLGVKEVALAIREDSDNNEYLKHYYKKLGYQQHNNIHRFMFKRL